MPVVGRAIYSDSLNMFMLRGFWLVVSVLIAAPLVLAQAPTLTIEEVVTRAVAQYPSVRVSQSQVDAATAGIALARTAYLPKVDVIAGINRATRNNVFGLLLPSQVIAPITGPVLGTNDLTSVWSSTAGVLATWEPFDFGLRQANVNVASATRDRARAGIARTQLEVASMAAEAYLTLLAAEQTIQAAQAGVERSQTVQRIVGALVRAELRPGAEESRVRAEIAAAQNQVIQARQAAALARATIAQLLNLPAIAVFQTRLPGSTPPTSAAAFSLTANPLAAEQNAAILEAQARAKALDHAYVPRLLLQGAAYGRGSGARTDGSTGGFASGLGPNYQNWGIGFTINWALFDLPSIRIRRDIEKAHERTERARYDLVLRELNGRLLKAQATLDAARELAANAPVELEAARAAQTQSLARYQAGLSSIVDVADTQRALTQAEIDQGLATLGIWRALLGVAIAQGDLTPFLNQVKE